MMRFFSRRRRDEELDDEIRTHLSMAIQDRIARGESRHDAERAARREFGNVAHVKELTRASWGGLWLERFGQDLRYGVRSLLHAPGFATVAVVTIALGIGTTTSMFTVVNGVLLRPLPFRDPERLVAVSYGPPRGPMQGGNRLADAHFLQLKERPSPFAGVATFSNQPVTLTGAGDPVRLNAASVTTEFLDVLGVAPAIGHGFPRQPSEPGAGAAVIVGDGLWHSRFGADPRIVGSTVTLDGVPRTVVGVMPAGFIFPSHAELWIPTEVRLTPGNSFSRPVVARLRDDMTMDQARSGFATLAATFREDNGDSTARAAVIPLKTLVIGDVRRPLMIFSGAVALVLLIACTNVANLLLMRAGTREREMAVRAAIGAGRGRLVRQLLTESVLIAAVGGAAGVLLAFGAVKVLLTVVPPGTLPRMDDIEVNGVVLAFTLAVVVAAGIGFGLAPAFHATGRDLREPLAEGARTHSVRPGRLRGALVVVQIALALVLLTGAGLLVRSFQRIRAVHLGFRPQNVLTLGVQLPGVRYKDAASMQELHRRVVDGLARIPGVEAAGAVNWRPLGNMHLSGDIQIEGRELPPQEFNPYKLAVSGDYFRAMGITLRRGRAFTARDGASAPGVVVISRSVADLFWPGGDPLGNRLSLEDHPKPGDWRTIVGVVDDVVQQGVMTGAEPAVYQPLDQVTKPSFLGNMNFVVRSAGGLEVTAPAIRDVMRDADPQLPVQVIETMDRLVLSTVGERLFQTRLLGVFSVLALVLAAVGVFGVMAYAVTERRHEIGIRIALGARARDVIRMVLRRTLTLVVPGVLLGVVCALAVTRVLSRLLFDIDPTDPATFVAVAALLGAVAIMAAVIPARRAGRVNPVEVLRG
jgi:putative ABC transport system permease protein